MDSHKRCNWDNQQDNDPTISLHANQQSNASAGSDRVGMSVLQKCLQYKMEQYKVRWCGCKNMCWGIQCHVSIGTNFARASPDMCKTSNARKLAGSYLGYTVGVATHPDLGQPQNSASARARGRRNNEETRATIVAYTMGHVHYPAWGTCAHNPRGGAMNTQNVAAMQLANKTRLPNTRLTFPKSH